MVEATKSGWVKVVLGVSLALNVFFVGLYGGSLFQGKPEKRGSAPASFLSTLNAERQEDVKAHFAEQRKARKESRKKRRAAWAEVRKVMTTEPFDRTALEAAMNKVLEERIDSAEIRYQQIVGFVSTMTPEERVAFSDAMNQRWKRRLKERRKREAE